MIVEYFPVNFVLDVDVVIDDCVTFFIFSVKRLEQNCLNRALYKCPLSLS